MFKFFKQIDETVLRDSENRSAEGCINTMAKKALIIDDEEALREIIVEALNLMDIESVTAPDGKEGLNLLKKHADETDLVIVDLFMPQMTGEQFYKKMITFKPDCPVIFISGLEEEDNPLRFRLEPHHRFLKKPFTIAQLKENVEQLI